MSSSQLHFEAQLTFTKYNERYKVEKPYAFKVPLEDAEIPSSNIDHSSTSIVRIANNRGCEGSFSLSKHGFTILPISDSLSYGDYHDEVKVQEYFRELEALLMGHLGAKDVKVFRHAIRERDPAWPDEYKGETYASDQPSTVAHIDCTPREIYQEVRRHHAADFDRLSKSRIQWMNVCKPLKGPLNDWPLIFCDSSTVDKTRDLEPADVVYPDHVAENTCIYHSERFKWYFLSGQKTSEVVVFVQGDTLVGAAPGVPHCSVRNPRTPVDEAPRESIEVRCLVFYG